MNDSNIQEKDYGPLIDEQLNSENITDEKERAYKKDFLTKWMKAMDRLEDPCKPIKEPVNKNGFMSGSELVGSLCAHVINEMIKMEQEENTSPELTPELYDVIRTQLLGE